MVNSVNIGEAQGGAPSGQASWNGSPLRPLQAPKTSRSYSVRRSFIRGQEGGLSYHIRM